MGHPEFSFKEIDAALNSAASAADASRDTIWQRNCDAADQRSSSNDAVNELLRSKIIVVSITIAVENPLKSNCSAKSRAAPSNARYRNCLGVSPSTRPPTSLPLRQPRLTLARSVYVTVMYGMCSICAVNPWVVVSSCAWGAKISSTQQDPPR